MNLLPMSLQVPIMLLQLLPLSTTAVAMKMVRITINIYGSAPLKAGWLLNSGIVPRCWGCSNTEPALHGAVCGRWFEHRAKTVTAAVENLVHSSNSLDSTI